jgi:hypothetical protein
VTRVYLDELPPAGEDELGLPGQKAGMRAGNKMLKRDGRQNGATSDSACWPRGHTVAEVSALTGLSAQCVRHSRNATTATLRSDNPVLVSDPMRLTKPTWFERARSFPVTVGNLWVLMVNAAVRNDAVT